MKEKQQTIIKKSALAPTVIVSGGGGFIGSHLVEALLIKDARVVVLDNFSTGKRSYLSGVMENPKFTLIECDINDGIPKGVESADYVIHLAASESYIYGDENITLDSLLTNAIGTKNLLDLSKKSSSKFLLASTIDIYQGLISSLDIAHYFGQTETEEKRFSYSEAKRFAEALVWEYYKKFNLNSRIVRLPEVYGPRMDFSSGSELGRLVNLLLNRENLVVYGDGLEKNYYLYITDTVSGIIKALFNEDSEGKIYTLSGSDSVTTIELTYLLKNLSQGHTEVVFKNASDKNKPKEVKISPTDNLNWVSKVSLKEGVTKTLRWYGYDFEGGSFKPPKFVAKEEREGITTIKPETFLGAAPEAPKAPAPPPQTPVKPSVTFAPKAEVESEKPKRTFDKIKSKPLTIPLIGAAFSIFLALLLFAVIPILKTLYFANKGYSHLNAATENLEKLSLSEAQQNGSKALASFTSAHNSLNNLGWLFILLKEDARFRNYSKLLKIAEYSSSAATNTSIGAKPLTEIWDNLKPNSKSGVSEAAIRKSVVSFKSAREDLERAEGEIKELNVKTLPKKYVSKINEVSEKIPHAKEALSTVEAVAYTLPKLLGVNGSKKYLILFENPNELRATGGFIGSYAVVEIENGKIKEITIDDIYNIDGLLDLNNFKTPSYDPIKKYAKQDYLRIRDANWNPSFPESANTILKLFEAANGVKFNGVVAIDTYLTEGLLKATGPIFLTAYNEEIKAENLYEKAQYYSEASYIEGSQQKKAFLTVLGSKLLETIFSLPDEKISEVAKEIFSNLDQKHILVFLPNSELSPIIAEKGWDGTVSATKTDYIFIVDSNVGANKANYLIEESAKYEIKNTYRDGSLEVNLTISYKHLGKDLTWPGGPYTDYLRVLVPKESFLHKASRTDTGRSETDITKAVVTSEESGKRTFEVPFILNPREGTEINFNYTLPSSISVGKGEKVYSLYWQKQPGTKGMPISIIFNTPFGKEVVETNPPFTKERDTYKFSTSLAKDLKATIRTK